MLFQRASSVKEALELLGGREALEGAEAWTQLSIEQPPVVLLLHLKCFAHTDGLPAKIVKPIDYPIELKIDPSKCNIWFFLLYCQMYLMKDSMYNIKYFFYIL